MRTVASLAEGCKPAVLCPCSAISKTRAASCLRAISFCTVASCQRWWAGASCCSPSSSTLGSGMACNWACHCAGVRVGVVVVVVVVVVEEGALWAGSTVEAGGMVLQALSSSAKPAARLQRRKSSDRMPGC